MVTETAGPVDAAIALDAEAQARPQEIEAAYHEALAAAPQDLRLVGHWLSYLESVARADQLEDEWARLRPGLEGEAQALVEQVHLPLGAMLLRHSRIRFLDQVIADAESLGLAGDPRLKALKRRNESLRVADHDLCYAPAPYTEQGLDWWRQGPFLLPREEGGQPLTSWLAGAVEAVEDDTVYCSALYVSDEDKGLAGDEQEGPPFRYRVSLASARRALEERLGPLPAKVDAVDYPRGGRVFFELGHYGETEAGPEAVEGMRGALHDSSGWRPDPDLPQPYLDPLRYLKKAGWVIEGPEDEEDQ